MRCTEASRSLCVPVVSETFSSGNIGCAANCQFLWPTNRAARVRPVRSGRCYYQNKAATTPRAVPVFKLRREAVSSHPFAYCRAFRTIPVCILVSDFHPPYSTPTRCLPCRAQISRRLPRIPRKPRAPLPRWSAPMSTTVTMNTSETYSRTARDL